MDLDKVKRNINKMGSLGATEQEIDAYISGEGVTAEQLRAHGKQAPKETRGTTFNPYNALSGVLNSIPAVRAFNHIREGKQDPRYSQLGGFSGEGLRDLSALSQIERGKVTTMTDKGYGNVVKSALGDRMLGEPVLDKHGQEIITYKGDDGKRYETYVNKPGLDGQDVDRFANSALPYVVGGGLAAKLGSTIGFGLMGRTALQGGTAAGVDRLAQEVAQEDGSGEEIDNLRTRIAALGGAGGEVVGSLLSRALNTNGLIDKRTGKLTEKGKEWARANRIEPDALSNDIQNYIGQNIRRARNPEELAVKARAAEFGIPTSKAQRTKSYDDAYTELQIEKGQRTANAEQIFKKFKEDQKLAIDDAATTKVGDQLAPKARGKEADTLGDDIRFGLNEIKERSEGVENKLWSEIGPMYPKDGAFKSLPDIVNERVQKAGISPVAGLTDASNDMTKIMQKFMTGELKSESMGVLTKRANDNIIHKKGSIGDFLVNYPRKEKGIPRWDVINDYNQYRLELGLDEVNFTKVEAALRDAGLPGYKQAMRVRIDLDDISSLNAFKGTDLDGTRRLSIDETRRLLLRKKNAAQPGSPDARLANNLYEGFNEWIDDAANKALIQADDPAAHLALKNARAFTREQKALFEPRDKSGKLTLAAKKISKIMEGADTPEGVVSAIFGRGTNVNELPEGTVSTLRALKRVMLPSDRAKSFDSVKMAYWGKLVLDKQGKVLSPKRLATNIDTALNKHKSAMKVMFSDGDIALIKRFSKVMKDLHVEHPKPSLTSIGMQQQTRKAIKGFLNATQQRERLVKGNIFRANLLSFMTKYVDAPMINTGGILARRHTTQDITTTGKNYVPISGSVGAIGIQNGQKLERPNPGN